jgi:hypothetical protein
MVEASGAVGDEDSAQALPELVHEPLESHGSRCSAVALAYGQIEAGSHDESGRTSPRAFGPVAHPLELAAYPPNDIGIDPFQGRTQLRLEGVAAVADPAADAQVVHRGNPGHDRSLRW